MVVQMYWCSPLPLSSALIRLLTEAGLRQWTSAQSLLPEADCWLIYHAPDHCVAFSSARAHDEPLVLAALVNAYKQLLSCSEQTAQPLLASWHLEQLGPKAVQQALRAQEQTASALSKRPVAPELPSPLVASTTLALLEAEPLLLEAYLDLELRAALLGREPDLHFHQRMRKVAHQGDALMKEWREALLGPVELREQLADSQKELKEAREEAELTLLQLHQVQEELEAQFLEAQAKQQQLEACTAQLAQTRAQESRLTDLEQQLSARDAELREAREEAELTLLQLHQVQEELEHYFLLSRGQQHLLAQHGDQQLRVQQLIAQLIHP